MHQLAFLRLERQKSGVVPIGLAAFLAAGALPRVVRADELGEGHRASLPPRQDLVADGAVRRLLNAYALCGCVHHGLSRAPGRRTGVLSREYADDSSCQARLLPAVP